DGARARRGACLRRPGGHHRRPEGPQHHRGAGRYRKNIAANGVSSASTSADTATHSFHSGPYERGGAAPNNIPAAGQSASSAAPPNSRAMGLSSPGPLSTRQKSTP